jgi:hypothetical protein
LQLANEEAEIGLPEEAAEEEKEADQPGHERQNSTATTGNLSVASEDNHLSINGRRESGTGHLTPTSEASSIPPTPDLVHQRSSTALSMVSSVQTAPDRVSLAQNPKVVEASERVESVHGDLEGASGSVHGDAAPSSSRKQKQKELEPEEKRPVTARMVEA